MSWFLENNIQYISMIQLNSDNILYTPCPCAQMKRNVNVLSVMSLPICYCHHREFGVFGSLTDVSSWHIWYLPSPPPPAEREIDRGRPRIACLVPCLTEIMWVARTNFLFRFRLPSPTACRANSQGTSGMYTGS